MVPKEYFKSRIICFLILFSISIYPDMNLETGFLTKVKEKDFSVKGKKIELANDLYLEAF